MKKATRKVQIDSRCKLGPITELELMEYCFYLLYHTAYIANTALKGSSDGFDFDWEDTEQCRELVTNSNAWDTLKAMWDYAEHGVPPEFMHPTAFVDHFSDLFKWSAVCETVQEHDGSLGFESWEVREAGNKLAYKCIARHKLDHISGDPNDIYDIPVLHAYPHAYDHRLSTLEYALLAGFSHIGAVRNEIANKTAPLIVEKEGNVSYIPLTVARQRLPQKRKFVPTKGIDYAV